MCRLFYVLVVGALTGLADQRAFEELSLDAALGRARAADKPVFVQVYVDWSLPCQLMRQATYGDARVIELLRSATIAIELDYEKNADALKPYEVDRFPTMLLLDGDGRERDRLREFLPPELLADELRGALAGRDAVQRARDAVEKSGRRDPLARERLAAALVRAGRLDEGLAEYLWCLDSGLQNLPYAAGRRSVLAMDLAALARAPRTGAGALDERRERLEAAIRAGRDEANSARTLGLLNRELGEGAKNLALFDSLAERSNGRRILFDQVFDQLVEARRYGEIASTIDPTAAFAAELRTAKAGGGAACCSLHAKGGPGTDTYVIERGARLAEVLAGVGRRDEAEMLAERVIAQKNTAENRALVERRVARGRAAAATRPAAP